MVTGSVDHTPRAPAPQTRNSKRWRIRVSIPVPRRCERRTLPIELIPHICGFKTQPHVYDWLAEWSKALVLGTSLFGGVGSNPTPVIFGFQFF